MCIENVYLLNITATYDNTRKMVTYALIHIKWLLLTGDRGEYKPIVTQ